MKAVPDFDPGTGKKVYHLTRAHQVAQTMAHQVAERQDARIEASWVIPEDPQNVPQRPPGLSNGAKRAVTVRDDVCDQYTGRGFVAQIESKPGTIKARLRGLLSPRPPLDGGGRRKIERLSARSKGNQLELTRELGALGYVPDWMVTLLMPGNWENSLSADGQKPDGRRLKRLFAAFLKRWKRRFGEWRSEPYTTCEAAQIEADRLANDFVQTSVRKLRSGQWEVVGYRYRLLWWLEFQRRGAPHVHLLFFDCRGLDWAAIRDWTGPAWAAVVAGLRGTIDRYLEPAVIDAYNEERATWGREIAEGTLEAQGLDPEVFHHLRAGTRVEEMRHKDWRYVAAETSGGRGKGYQKQVPENYQNVGRWWGYQKFKRARPDRVNFDIRSQRELREFLGVMAHGISQLPPEAVKFRAKAGRFFDALLAGEDFGYLTLWGEPARQATLGALNA